MSARRAYRAINNSTATVVTVELECAYTADYQNLLRRAFVRNSLLPDGWMGFEEHLPHEFNGHGATAGGYWTDSTKFGLCWEEAAGL